MSRNRMGRTNNSSDNESDDRKNESPGSIDPGHQLSEHLTVMNRTLSAIQQNQRELAETLGDIRECLMKRQENQSKEKPPQLHRNIQTPFAGFELVPEQVNLNVGGKLFSVSKDTLCKQASSYFTGLLGSIQWSKPQNEGPFFIDRDPKYFKIIINFLRTGILDLSKLTETQVGLLKQELDYFQIEVDPAVFPKQPTTLSTPLTWDPAFTHPQLVLSEDNRRVSNTASEPDNIFEEPCCHRILCTTPGVTTFSVKVTYDSSETDDCVIGFVSRNSFCTTGLLDNFWRICGSDGTAFSRQGDNIEDNDYMNSQIPNNSIITASYDQTQHTIRFMIDGVDKGVAFTNIPQDIEDLCPMVGIPFTSTVSFELVS